jgi:CheY-like chemotaxis protein
VRLTVEAFKELDIQSNFIVVHDGEEALKFLYKKGKYKDRYLPDLILLDLNTPKKDGREVLAEIKKVKLLKNPR